MYDALLKQQQADFNDRLTKTVKDAVKDALRETAAKTPRPTAVLRPGTNLRPEDAF